MKTLIVTFILVAFTVVADDTNQASLTFHQSLGKTGDERRAAWLIEASKGDAKSQAWLIERLKAAQTIKIGSTYAELSKHFNFDGGPNGGNGNFRCVMISCNCIKIDVELTDNDGNKVKSSIFDIIPADARVTKISKPYLEEPLSD
jgi:hypothetical protein